MFQKLLQPNLIPGVKMLYFAIFIISPTASIYSQLLDIEGNVKIVLDHISDADSVVVQLPDSTLGIIAKSDLLKNLSDPIDPQDAATKSYIDQLITEVLNNMANQNESFSSPSTGTVTDPEGNSYNIIKIRANHSKESSATLNSLYSNNPMTQGSQWWMAENLRSTKYNDGTPIPKVTSNADWIDLNTPGYCWYDNDSLTHAQIYGALYNFYTVADTNQKNVCPLGWHVPTIEEWNILIDFIDPGAVPAAFIASEIAGGKMKQVGTTYWNIPNLADNETGLTALPAGTRASNSGEFFNIGNGTVWWSSSELTDIYAQGRGVLNNSTRVIYLTYLKGLGESVRCVRD